VERAGAQNVDAGLAHRGGVPAMRLSSVPQCHGSGLRPPKTTIPFVPEASTDATWPPPPSIVMAW